MLLTNPLSSPYFLPAVAVVGSLLGAAAFALALGYRFNSRRIAASVLFHRWLVWVAIAPIYTFSVLGGVIPTLLLMSAITFQGLREYATLAGLRPGYRRVLLAAGLLPAPLAVISNEGFFVLPAVLLVLATIQPVLWHGNRDGIRHLAFSALGWAYIAWFLAHLVFMRARFENGEALLLAIGLAVALSDVAAFVAGKTLGRHRLAPELSPSKTWEGVGGNLIGAGAGFGLMAASLPLRMPVLAIGGLPLLIGVGAAWGDLVESAIKREFGAKDAGTWLPGFGGLLDRVDSLLIVGPMVFYAVWLARTFGQLY
ncbi:MAG: phosphatidate cytidylyltransferase [Chloroflexi bacterium]|nr:phosphatidate cytidylyltransferase [Chloroflexota bacterium]